MKEGAKSGSKRIAPIIIIFCVLSIVGIGAVGNLKMKRFTKFDEDGKTETLQYVPNTRTYLASKLLLIPTLVAVGLKFLLLLPMFLSKIALLSIMNFVATNLNLLLSAVIGVKNFFSSMKPTAMPFESFGLKDPSTQYQLGYYQPQYLPAYELSHDKVPYHTGFPLLSHDDVKFKRSNLLKKKYRPPMSEESGSRSVFDENLLDQYRRTKYGQKGKYTCFWSNKDDPQFVKERSS